MSKITQKIKKINKFKNKTEQEKLDDQEGRELRSPVGSDDVKHDIHRNLQTGNLVQCH